MNNNNSRLMDTGSEETSPDITASEQGYDHYQQQQQSPEQKHGNSQTLAAAAGQQPVKSPYDMRIFELFKAAEMGLLPMCIKLREDGVDMHASIPQQGSALHRAVLGNHLPVVQWLVEDCRLDVNLYSGDPSSTPLHWACKTNKLKIVKYLVEHGGNINAKDGQGFNCLHVAAQKGNLILCLYLLSCGMNVDSVDEDNRTALMWAVYNHTDIALVKSLIKHGASLNIPDIFKSTPAHWAARGGNMMAWEELIMAGARLDMKDSKGFTPVERTREHRHIHLEEYLICKQEEMSRKTNQIPERRKKIYLNALTAMLFCLVTYILCFYQGFYSWLAALVVLVAGNQVTKMLWFKSATNYFYPPIVQLSFAFDVVAFGRILSWNHSYGAMFNMTVYITVIITLYLWRKVSSLDAGTIYPPGKAEEKRYMEECLEDSTQDSQWCVTCQLRKPLRSKHCATCNKCVARLDHHCPWLNNCIGLKNHGHFMGFMVFFSLCQLFFTLAAIDYFTALLSHEQTEPGTWNTIVAMYYADTLMFILGTWTLLHLAWESMMTCSQIWLISSNLTVNEFWNRYRYKYLQRKLEAPPKAVEEGNAGDHGHCHGTGGGCGPRGCGPRDRIVFYNPFNKGFLLNCGEFWSGKYSNVYTTKKV
eukprot:Nk52_evm37s293 gene=Nk52_evmTU37s293